MTDNADDGGIDVKKGVIGAICAGGLCMASAASAAVTIDFTNPSGNFGLATQKYPATGNASLFVVATGYAMAGSKTNLYGKTQGGDEIGLGLNADTSGQHEIYRGAFVQLNVTDLFGKVSSALFHFGSDTSNEQWEVYGSNSDGQLGDALLYGINDEANHDLLGIGGWGKYAYYNFRSLGTGTGGLAGYADSKTGNVLLGNLVLTSAVPEPSTWAMMLVGLGAIGMAVRRRRTGLIVQTAQ